MNVFISAGPRARPSGGSAEKHDRYPQSLFAASSQHVSPYERFYFHSAPVPEMGEKRYCHYPNHICSLAWDFLIAYVHYTKNNCEELI